MSMKGRTIVVTGASSGIGAAIARELAAAGASLVITARREDRLRALCEELRTETAYLAADIADPGTPDALLALAIKRFGRADVIVNNAGVLAIATLETADLDEMCRMIRVNYEAVVRSCYVFARAFKAQGSGAIINVTSIGASVVAPTVGVYAGSKRAVQGFTDALRVELAGTGVKVGTVAPGSTETEMQDALRVKFGIPPTMKMLEAEDVAAAVRFMLEQSDRANIAQLAIYAAQETT